MGVGGGGDDNMAIAYDSGSLAGTYLLRAFGFDPTRRLVLQSLCRLSSNRSRAYTLLGPADEDKQPPSICLVNMSDAEAIARWREVVDEAGEVPSVLVADEEPEIPGPAVYHCSPRRLSSTLLAFLDNIVVEHYGPSARRDIGVDTCLSSATAYANRDGDAIARALVVDDSEAVRAQLQAVLQRHAVEVDLCEDATSALETLESNAYDVIFLDVILPDMEGFKACRRIKSDARTRDIPVIMLTSKCSRFNKVQGHMAGCDRYLTKPASEKQVLEALQACMDVSAQRQT